MLFLFLFPRPKPAQPETLTATSVATKAINAFFIGYPLSSCQFMHPLTTRLWPTDEQVIEAAINKPVFRTVRQPALRLILERLELSERGKKSEDHFISEGLQIEHIMPQQWSVHWPLNGVTVPQYLVSAPFLVKDEFVNFGDTIRARNEKLHTLGNLTLLNKYLNPAASNGSFNLKKAEYANSILRLNRYFDNKADWDENGIGNRGKELGQKICKIWPRR